MSHNQIYDEIKIAWDKYSDDTVSDIKKAVKKVSTSAIKKIKKKSPKKTGDYANAWRRKTSKETDKHISIIISQTKKPFLTYILEKGKRYHGLKKYQIKGQRPHIEEVEIEANNELSTKIDSILRKQGKK